MALWPLTPAIALAGVGVALSQQKSSDLLIAAAIVVCAAVYYAVYLRPRHATHWNAFSDPETELARLATEGA
jgi:uncharacterized membrane protein YfcA